MKRDDTEKGEGKRRGIDKLTRFGIYRLEPTFLDRICRLANINEGITNTQSLLPLEVTNYRFFSD